MIGTGLIGVAIARRGGSGKDIVLADLKQQNADIAAKPFVDAGFEVSTAVVDISKRESIHALVETATTNGSITGLIHAAGVSPSQASHQTILPVLSPYKALADIIESSGLHYTILRPDWFTNGNEIDYTLTKKGEPETGTAILQKSIAAFIKPINENPGLHTNENLGISKPN